MDSMIIHKSNKTVNNRTKQEVLRFIIAKLLKFDRYSGYILQRIKKEVHNSRKNCELLFSHMYCLQSPY